MSEENRERAPWQVRTPESGFADVILQNQMGSAIRAAQSFQNDPHFYVTGINIVASNVVIAVGIKREGEADATFTVQFVRKNSMPQLNCCFLPMADVAEIVEVLGK